MSDKKFASKILSGLESSLKLIADNSSYQSDEWKIRQLNNLIMTIAELCKDEICNKSEITV